MRETEPSSLRACELLLVTALYLGLALWWLWPLPLHLGTHAAYAAPSPERQGADWHLIAWALAWVSHALATSPLHVFDANAFHPAPWSLAFSEHFLGDQPLFAPIYLATGNAVLAVNLLLLAMFTFSAVGFHALARRFVAVPAAFVGGMLFSFTPWRHENLLHFHVLGVQYLPLALLFTERWLERARARDAWLLGAALLLQALSSVYLAFALGLLYGPYLLLAAWRWRRRLDGRRVRGLAAALAALAVGMAVTSVPYVRLAALGVIPSYGSGEYGPTLGVVFARGVVWDYLTTTGVGPVGYALVLIGLLPPWRRRRWPVALSVVAVVVGILVACGSRGLPLGGWVLPAPFPWLTRIFPPVAAIRLPARVLIVAHLGLCLAAALGLQRLLGRLRFGVASAGAAGAAAGLLVSYPALPAPPLHAVPPCSAVPEPSAWLARHGAGRPLLELPAPAPPPVAARRMFRSRCHWLPVVGGYTAYPVRVAEIVDAAARGLPGRPAVQQIVDTIDLGWIVVHLDELPPPERRRWDGPLPAGLEEAARFPDALVLRVTLAPGPDSRRERLFSSTETLGGVPLRPLGSSCRGRLRLLGRPPVLRPGQRASVRVAVTNLGDRTWPGFGVIPRHLVHVRACVTAVGTVCRDLPRPLGFDLPAGETQSFTASVAVAPIVLKPQELRVELWQLGDVPLERCGTPPLSVPVQIQRAPRRPVPAGSRRHGGAMR